MADFFPRQGPEYQDDNLRRLVKWAEGEFQKLARTQTEAGLVPLQEHHVAIEKPREGMLARADGSDWDPGSGRGTYEYVDSAWRKLNGLEDGDYGDISVSGGVITIDNNAVTLAKLADIATARFLGRITASSGDPEELTGTQATTLLDAFTDALKGLAPASGGGTVNFLRADGSWAVPPSIVLQVLQDNYTTNVHLTTQIPSDNTTPTSSEGTEVLSQAVTLADAANKVLVEFSAFGATSTTNGAILWAIFRGTTCIQAGKVATFSANDELSVVGDFLDTPGSVGPHTYSVRVGPSGAYAVRLNGDTANALFGGAASATLTVSEVKV